MAVNIIAVVQPSHLLFSFAWLPRAWYLSFLLIHHKPWNSDEVVLSEQAMCGPAYSSHHHEHENILEVSKSASYMIPFVNLASLAYVRTAEHLNSLHFLDMLTGINTFVATFNFWEKH